MKSLLIVFCSRTGGTRQMAEAASRGAASEAGMHARLLHAPDAKPADVLTADGYIFATPENFGGDRRAYERFLRPHVLPGAGIINGRPYATLICAGSDGHNAARQITRIATGWRLRPIAEPLIVCTQAQTPEAIQAPKVIGHDDLARCGELGAALAAGMAMGVF